MRDYRLKTDYLHLRITEMLELCEESEDCFVKFFHNRLSSMYDEVTETYEEQISSLERKILELEKELIFANLPAEQHR
jgi:hypothetical protein